ncbi:MAG: T9SS type A sorting domain-containing protein, partial [Candidatus Marinimicrobia bacterium]|nr:T9SS type A sorting domain-containing protein [Candidatus Neomarinimicrobiota bacterium]
TDGGGTWIYQTYESPNSDTINDTFRDVSFFDANNGMICGSGATQVYGSFVCRTIDGGATWNVIYNSGSNNYHGVSSLSANTCIAVGSYQGSAAYGKTTDGGASWDSYYFNSITDPLYDVKFVDENIGTAVGYNGRILRTTNGAESWSNQATPTSNNLRVVDFTDANTGTAVGDYGTIVRTTNGGASWDIQQSGTNEQLRGVAFIDENNGRIVGRNGTILKTTDGGTTWEIQPVGTNEDLFSVSFVDENYGNIVGGRGIILRTTDGGITSIIEGKNYEFPKGFVLMQNYPNPFNPTTTISYALPEQSMVKLTVFDIRGHEVMTIVSTDKSPGNYEAQWNGIDHSGNQVSTGVYFARLQAGSYSQSIKMVYLK